MAEGGEPQIVYHIKNVESLNVVEEENITNIDSSSVGVLEIGADLIDREDEGFAANNESIRLQSDDFMDSPPTKQDEETNEEEVTWLQSGKFGMYSQQPLQKGAHVYRGKQRLLSEKWRDVAIKIIPYNEKNNKEIEFLIKLNHRNVVRIIDAGVDNRFGRWIYIVMEFCPQNLQDYIDENQHQPVNFDKSRSFAEQLVTGLAFLHRNNIVHRDLKPDNVLVSLCKEVVKLSDFGLSEEIQDNRSVATVTSVGVGSEGYRSPETYITGSKVTSRRLDVFPLGLIFHLLFTNGKHPFGSNPYNWSYNIRKYRNLDLSQIPEFDEPNAKKKAQLLDLIKQMLRYNPRDRPTADEVKSHIFFKEAENRDGNSDIVIDILPPNSNSQSNESIDHIQPSDTESSGSEKTLEGKFSKKQQL